MALSLVMTSWVGTSSTVSIMLSLRPMRSNIGTIRLSPGRKVPDIAAEALDGVFAALRHRLDAHQHQQDDQRDQHQHEDGKPAELVHCRLPHPAGQGAS